LAVPVISSGLETESPGAGNSTKIAGVCSSKSVRACGASPPIDTRRTVGNWVSV
jgi:hypothetical protein